MNGSSRAPNFDLVRRTPLPTARTRPWLAGQQGDDAVGLAELLGAQHDTLVPVEAHHAIIRHRWSDGRMARLLISDVSLADGSGADVLVEDDRVVEVLPAGWEAGSGDLVVDGGGGLLLPAYVDTHIHLDKVLIRDQLVEHDGTLRGAIEAIHAAKRDYDVEDVRRRARAVIESSVLTGTTRLRSHVDVDTIGGLVPLEGVLAAARDCADIAEVQVIAFPQEGILRDPGAADLMAEAMTAGATVVGGMPHWEQGEDGPARARAVLLRPGAAPRRRRRHARRRDRRRFGAHARDGRRRDRAPRLAGPGHRRPRVRPRGRRRRVRRRR